MTNEKQGRSVRVIQPGPLTLIQDRGRQGFQQLGVSVSGAADLDALDTGNRLVGNDEAAAGLEVMLGGLSLEFSESAVFCLTGADTGAFLDGVALGTNVSYLAHAGGVLELGMASSGLRAYVSIAGGFEIEPTLGSRSTHVASELGGVNGRRLEEGDVLGIGDPSANSVSGVTVDQPDSVTETELEIRVVLGPQDHLFSDEGIKTFLQSEYVVSDQSNRQGLRLNGEVVGSKSGSYDIISDAVVNGSVQIPGDGKPIILLADRQTTGGYAKIATVASVDLHSLGQAAPGKKIRFREITIQEAQQLLKEKRSNRLAAIPAPVVEPTPIKVDGIEVQIGVAENGNLRIASIDGISYPISVEENSPAN